MYIWPPCGTWTMEGLIFFAFDMHFCHSLSLLLQHLRHTMLPKTEASTAMMTIPCGGGGCSQGGGCPLIRISSGESPWITLYHLNHPVSVRVKARLSPAPASVPPWYSVQSISDNTHTDTPPSPVGSGPREPTCIWNWKSWHKNPKNRKRKY